MKQSGKGYYIRVDAEVHYRFEKVVLFPKFQLYK